MIINEPAEVRVALLKATFHASNYLGIQLGNSKHCEDLLAVIEIALNDSGREVRLAAIWLLAWIRHSRAEELLIKAYHAADNQPFRREIRQIATSLGSPTADLLNNEKE